MAIVLTPTSLACLNKGAQGEHASTKNFVQTPSSLYFASTPSIIAILQKSPITPVIKKSPMGFICFYLLFSCPIQTPLRSESDPHFQHFLRLEPVAGLRCGGLPGEKRTRPSNARSPPRDCGTACKSSAPPVFSQSSPARL